MFNLLNKCLLCLIVLFFTSCQKMDVSYDGDIIVVIPDIQHFSDGTVADKFQSPVKKFIRKNKDSIICCLQTGDITNNNTSDQWNVGGDFLTDIANMVPLAFCLGNHDFGNNGSTEDMHTNCPDHIISLVNSDTMFDKYNYVKYIEINNKPWAILSLQFCVTEEMINWAETIIGQENDCNYILLTHGFLNKDGDLYNESDIDCDNSDSPKAYKVGQFDSYDLFERLIYFNSNVKMVISGHSLPQRGYTCNTMVNNDGNVVQCLTVNFQEHLNCGNGAFAFISFDETGYELNIIVPSDRNEKLYFKN